MVAQGFDPERSVVVMGAGDRRAIVRSVTRRDKLFFRLVHGRSDHGFSFEDLCSLVRSLGFIQTRQSGSHRIFARDGVEEILNLQPRGSEAKDYQVRQVREVVLKYKLKPSRPTDSDDA